MTTKLSYDVIHKLNGRTLATAESCTGGGIGAALTAIPGSSKVYKGGIISYTNEVKISQLNVSPDLLDREGAVSAAAAQAMAQGVCEKLQADIGVSVTGLAGPDGDVFGNPVGTVFIGLAVSGQAFVKQYHFTGDRASVREQAVNAALNAVLEVL